jgi:hypothetical protein
MENFALCLFHVRRIFVVLVIVADQMQEAMHGKMGDMMSERLVFAARLSRDGFKGKNNVAEMSTKRLAGHVFGRERQHIGGRIDAAPIPVEQANCRIISQNDSKLRPAC